MFFDFKLLTKNGKLSIPWLVGNKKKLLRNKIEQVNIVKSCEQIMIMLSSNSSRPEKRLSLRLASKLTYGIIIIYSKQVIYLREDLYNIYTSIYTLKTLISKGVTTPKIRGKKRKRVQSPEVNIDNTVRRPAIVEETIQPVQDLPHLLPDSQYITLPEPAPQSGALVNIEPFGDEGQIPAILEDLILPLQIEETALPSFLQLPEITDKDTQILPTELPKDSDEITSRPKRTKVTIDTDGFKKPKHVSTPVEQVTKRKSSKHVSESSISLGSLEEGEKRPKKRIRKKKLIFIDNGIVISSEILRERLNTTTIETMQLTMPYPHIIEAAQLIVRPTRKLIAEDIKKTFRWMKTDHDFSFHENILHESSGSSTVPRARLLDNLSISDVPGVKDVSGDASTPGLQQSRTEPLIPLPLITEVDDQIKPIDTPISTEITVPHVTMPTDLIIDPEILVEESVIPEKEPSEDRLLAKALYDTQEIHKKILTKLKNMWETGMTDITFEMLCPVESTKRIEAARTFRFLLDLVVKQYIIITRKQTSSEIEFIHKRIRI